MFQVLIMLSENSNNFTFFKKIFILPIPFSCLITLARVSSTMLNNSSNSECSCLHTSWLWTFQCFLSRCNASFWIKIGLFYQVKKKYINSNFTKKVFRKCMLNFAKCIFSIYQDDPLPVLLRSICYNENCYKFLNVTSQNKFHLIMGSLNVLLNSADILFRIFAWYS